MSGVIETRAARFPCFVGILSSFMGEKGFEGADEGRCPVVLKHGVVCVLACFWRFQINAALFTPFGIVLGDFKFNAELSRPSGASYFFFACAKKK
ncbi:hypothetical protein [Xanthomonas citri]|uniref:hypothetical protein n=1 Tax=Xanthomonas citri TaxID=346 RepID=UPI000FD65428|nr:hypothetical protein [Xanthomonas citri]QTJ31044.1 hypothetical protein XcfCFBP6167P_24535 [Xanthomonas citri pv. phaseoli var. fuscans]